MARPGWSAHPPIGPIDWSGDDLERFERNILDEFALQRTGTRVQIRDMRPNVERLTSAQTRIMLTLRLASSWRSILV